MHASYRSHRLRIALTICSQDLLKCHGRRMLVHHVTFLNGIFKNSYHPFLKMFIRFQTLYAPSCVLFLMQTSFLRNLSSDIPQNRSMASEDQSCPQNKPQKGHSRSQCLIPDILLPYAESGGSCSTFPPTLRRFPFKNACRGPRAATTRTRMEGAEQSNPSLHYSLSFPCSNLLHVPDRKSLTREHHQLHRVGVRPTRSKPASLLCQPRRRAGKTASIPWERPGRSEQLQVLLLTKRRKW